MPTQKYQLTWLRPTKRWRKIFKGQIFYFPIRNGETMKSSSPRCFSEWETRRTQLIQKTPKVTPEQQEYQTAIQRWHQVRNWHAKRLDGDLSLQGYERATSMIDKLQKRLKGRNGDLPPLDRFEADPLHGVNEAGQLVWMDRQKQMQTTAKPINGTIAAIADNLIQVKREQVNADERSGGRYEALRCHLNTFRKWAGDHRQISDLTYDLLESYHKHLLRLSKSEISKYTARDRMQSVKQLATYAARKKLISPIIFDSHTFSFRLAAQTVKIADISHIQQLLVESSEKTQLYMLLMLNTAMTQKDISDLEQDQVDWRKSRIKRKRSKTKHQKRVPEVDYPLWSETFRLLKKYRSDHATYVLVNGRGGRLFEQDIQPNGKLKKNDNIKSAFSRIARKLNLTTITPKQFRATSATILAEHKNYHRLTQQFLGQAPTTIADRHYVVQSQELFDRAIKWLEKQYGIG